MKKEKPSPLGHRAPDDARMAAALRQQLEDVRAAKRAGDVDAAAKAAFILGSMLESARHTRSPFFKKALRMVSGLPAGPAAAARKRKADSIQKLNGLEILIKEQLKHRHTNDEILEFLMEREPKTGQPRSPFSKTTTKFHLKRIAARLRKAMPA